MPTYDFIRETVDDRFYERGGEGRRPSRVLPCPVCGEQLPDHAALSEHLGSAHPLSAPRLLIDGDVVVGERVVHRRLESVALELANTTQLLVSENGGPGQPWSVAALRDTLAEAERIVLDLSLRNQRAGDGAAAQEQVRLRVDVPDSAALDAADRCFEQLLASGELNEHQLDRFVDAVAESPGAGRYASALHDYGVAILIKDQAPGTREALPFAAHRDKLQRSLSVLRHFPERPVARAVSGFVRFGLNDLAGGTHPSGVPELDGCAAALGELAGVVPQWGLSRAAPVGAGRCPADDTTAFILDRWNNPAANQALIEHAARGSTTPEDAAKCRALAVRASVIDSSGEARDLARALMNDPVFGTWATQIVEDAVADG